MVKLGILEQDVWRYSHVHELELEGWYDLCRTRYVACLCGSMYVGVIKLSAINKNKINACMYGFMYAVVNVMVYVVYIHHRQNLKIK